MLDLQRAVCRGLTTPSFWIAKSGETIAVTVVLSGHAFAEQPSSVPPSYHIDASDFPTIKKLGMHLNDTMKNKEDYMSRLTWTHDYKKGHAKINERNLCTLCKMATERRQVGAVKLPSWWEEKSGQCKKDYGRVFL